jgi:hypothetical protein
MKHWTFFPAVACLVVLALPLAAQQPDTLRHSIPAPPTGVQSGAQLGFSVAVEGSYVVVGAPADDTQATDSGVVKVFDAVSGALLHVLANPNPAVGDRFGLAVAISGTRVVVGDYFDDTGASDAGSAYVYDLAGATPTVPVATLNNPGPAASDQFGYAVGHLRPAGSGWGTGGRHRGVRYRQRLCL